MSERTAAEYRALAAEEERKNADRYDRDELGISMAASSLNAQLYRRQAEIIEAGGVAEFPALFDLAGERVNAKLIDGKYGPCWMLLDAAGRSTGQFVSAFPAREATMARKGYREGTELAPVWAKIAAPAGARGISGMTSCYVLTFRTDGK